MADIPTHFRSGADCAALEIDTARLSAELCTSAFSVFDNALKPEFSAALLAHCKTHAGNWRHAGVGKNQHIDATFRGDRTRWLDGENNALEAELLRGLDSVRASLNASLRLNLIEVEAHFAHYPSGGRYVRHKDVFSSDASRVISLVLYLNPSWQPQDGGQLTLFLDTGAIQIAPKIGTLVAFVSAEIEHAVEPTAVDRFSVAAWFRRG